MNVTFKLSGKRNASMHVQALAMSQSAHFVLNIDKSSKLVLIYMLKYIALYQCYETMA